MLVLPSEALDWARENDVETANALLTADRRPQTTGGEIPAADLQITHPDQGTVYQISPVTPRETQQIAVSARVADDLQLVSLSLYVDGRAIATFSDPLATVREMWTLEPGTHMFTARGMDRSGRELVSPAVSITVLP
jgi:hypothetical protein